MGEKTKRRDVIDGVTISKSLTEKGQTRIRLTDNKNVMVLHYPSKFYPEKISDEEAVEIFKKGKRDKTAKSLKDIEKKKNNKSIEKTQKYLQELLNKKDASIIVKKNSSGDKIVSVNGQTAFNLDDIKGDMSSNENRKKALQRAYDTSKKQSKPKPTEKDFLQDKIEGLKMKLEVEKDKSEIAFLKDKIEVFEMMM